MLRTASVHSSSNRLSGIVMDATEGSLEGWRLMEVFINDGLGVRRVLPGTGADVPLTVTRTRASQGAAADVPEGATPHYGVLGVIQLRTGPHMVVATRRESVASVAGRNVYSVREVEIVRLTEETASNAEHESETHRMRSLRDLLCSGDFYYAPHVDLSRPVAPQVAEPFAQADSRGQWAAVDDHFVWNSHLAQPLMLGDLAPGVVPVIRGFVASKRAPLTDSVRVSMTLVARRSVKRAGARYLRRGVDPEGHVANFVVSEMLVESSLRRWAFVQVRGSVPLFWEQRGKQLKPKPRLVEDAAHAPALALHLSALVAAHGPIVAVTLLNGHGAEGAISERWVSEFAAWKKSAAAIPAVVDSRIFDWDFHRNCKASFDRVTDLVDDLTPDIARFGWYEEPVHGDTSGGPPLRQRGAFRVNCVDCLDRTNVVQSRLARKWVAMAVGVSISAAAFESEFNSLWADHGDAISRQYAGTEALKGDFTRTGKRNMRGRLNDGVNTLQRYRINTFFDRERQVAVDMLLGELNCWADVADADADDPSHAAEAMEAVRGCTRQLHVPPDDFVDGFVVVHVNRWGHLNQRVLVITSTYLYRCKYIFKERKLLRWRRVRIDAIEQLQCGMVGGIDSPVAAVRVLAPSEELPVQLFQAEASGNFAAETIAQLVMSIFDAVQAAKPHLSEPDVIVEDVELEVEKATNVYSKAFNTFGLGLHLKHASASGGGSFRGKSSTEPPKTSSAKSADSLLTPPTSPATAPLRPSIPRRGDRPDESRTFE